MGLFGGKSSGSQTVIPQLSQEQKDYIKAQTDFFKNVVQPTYQDVVKGAVSVYNQNAPGVLNAAQNLAGTSGQAQQTLGETGESALRTGVSGLENLFGKDYEQQQVAAALAPSQAQYMQNLAGQQAQFGATGELGSARQALAGRQLAGMTAAQQAQTAAQVEAGIAGQRQQAANALMGYGGQALPGSIAAAQQILGASQVPQQYFGQLANTAYGLPSASYTQIGPYGQSSTSSGKNSGFKLGGFGM
jgi:hypothetical protein